MMDMCGVIFTTIFLATYASFTAANVVQDKICANLVPGTYGNVTTKFHGIHLSDQFTVLVEAVLPDLGNIVNMQMTYASTPSPRLIVTQRAYKLNKLLYYDYGNDETLTYDFLSGGRGSCVVNSNMSMNADSWFIPNTLPKGDGSIAPVSEILRLAGDSGLGGEIVTYMNPSKIVRHVRVRTYKSCQRVYDSKGKPMIAEVEHYLSDDYYAWNRRQKGSFPVQIVFSAMYDNGDVNGKVIKRTYNFFRYFSKDVDPKLLEIPKGIVCENRKNNGKSFPEIEVYSSFSQEIHYPKGDRRHVEKIHTIYDQPLQFVSNTYFDHEQNREDQFRFDDFQTGLSYSIDYETNYCLVKNISDTMDIANDIEMLDDGKVKMASPQEFYSSAGVKYHYGGIDYIEGVSTERWHGKDPMYDGLVYEWYFMQEPEYSSVQTGDYIEEKTYRVPFKRMMWTDNTNKYYSNYFYEVDYTEPDLNAIDLTPCFPNSLSKDVYLYVPGLNPNFQDKHRVKALRKFALTLQRVLGVRFTRIAHLKIEFFEKKGYITFKLLDKSEFASDLIGTIPKENSLEQALDILKTNITSLHFEIGSSTNLLQEPLEIVERQHSFDHIEKPESSGYSSGTLAGMAIGMIIFGLGSGGAGGYWFFLRNDFS